MKHENVILGVIVLMLAFLVSFSNANAQILNQDLEKKYEQEKKDLSAQSQAPAAAGPVAADDGDGIEIGGPPPRENFSSLSQQDAGIILEAAKSLEAENPELAKKLLDIGK